MLPDELPAEVIPLNETDIKPVVFPDTHNLNGKNVYVELTNGRTLVGRFESDALTATVPVFTIGTSDELFSFEQIKTCREI